jgi:dihydrofolate synthase/folylpolyglutamate synthase
MKDALAYIYSFDFHKIDLGLDRMRAFLRHFGEPQKQIKALHVAGTNGKGSVSTYLSYALAQQYNTGLFISPHLDSFSERIQLNNKPIGRSTLIKLVREAATIKESTGIDVTYFEFLTALALKFFAEKSELAVLEVGLGGRLDSTNVVNALVSIITNISKEHTMYLGNSLKKIAYEKAGIIKRNSFVLTAERNDGIANLFEKKARSKNCEFARYGREFTAVRKKNSLRAQTFDFIAEHEQFYSMKNVKIRLLGEHQIKNASLAIASLQALATKGFALKKKGIKNGLEKTFIPARFEFVNCKRKLLFDVAHNPAGFAALRNALEEYFPEKEKLFVIGVSDDKDIKGIAREIGACVDKLICTKASFRGMDSRKVAKAFKPYVNEIHITETVKDACEIVLNTSSELAVFTGSFFSVSEARAYLRNFFNGF